MADGAFEASPVLLQSTTPDVIRTPWLRTIRSDMPVVRLEEAGASASSSVEHAALTFAVAWVDGVPRRMAGFKDVALSTFVASGTAARASAFSHVGSDLRPDARGVCWHLQSRRSDGSLAPLGCTTRMNTYLITYYLSEQLAAAPALAWRPARRWWLTAQTWGCRASAPCGMEAAEDEGE